MRKLLLLTLLTLPLAAGPITITAEYCARSFDAGISACGSGATYELSPGVTVDLTPGEVELDNFHGVFLDIEANVVRVRLLEDQVFPPDSFARWSFYTTPGDPWVQPLMLLQFPSAGFVRYLNASPFLAFDGTTAWGQEYGGLLEMYVQTSAMAFNPLAHNTNPFGLDPTPEPATMVLTGGALIGLAAFARRKR